jgi:hypothetical protein
MNELPQELVDRISYFLARDDLKIALLVSRKFQYATERASGAFACFTFTNHDSKERESFLDRFSGRRFRYLRKVEVYTKFPALKPRKLQQAIHVKRRKKRDPSPEPEPGSCRESLEDLAKKDEVFTDQVVKALEAIKTVEDTRDEQIGRMQLMVFTPTRQIHRCYCDHRRYSSWRVHLLSPERISKLHSVKGLSICNPGLELYIDERTQSKIDLRVLVDLAARCPNLEYLGCKLGVDEWTNSADTIEHFKHNYEACIRDTRNNFADAVRGVRLPTSLRYVQLDFVNHIYDAISEQRRPPPNLIGREPYDPFSSSLRLLSSQLRKMEIRVMADKTLFWPHESTLVSSWPNLESLNVMFHLGSPSGLWYFQSPSADRRYDKGHLLQEEPAYPPLENNRKDDEWHFASADRSPSNSPTFRVIPIEETMAPFLKSFAKAAATMPKLKEALLWAPLEFHPNVEDEEEEEEEAEEEPEEEDLDCAAIALYPDESLAWGITYVAPGGLAFDGGENDSSARQLWWRVGQWRPSKELHQLFQMIGKAQHGHQLMEYWSDSEYGNGLVAQEWFSRESVFTSNCEPYPQYF